MKQTPPSRRRSRPALGPRSPLPGPASSSPLRGDLSPEAWPSRPWSPLSPGAHLPTLGAIFELIYMGFWSECSFTLDFFYLMFVKFTHVILRGAVVRSLALLRSVL